MLSNDQSPAAEAYRMLRTNLQFAAVGKSFNTLLVTSPSEGDGKSMTASNLAAALAKIGRNVILVDADLRRPKLHRLFQVINNVGVTTALLADEWNFDILLQETSVPGLRVLTSGPLPPNPAELLGSQRMQTLLRALQTQADMVILDSPPVTLVSDTTILSTLVDGVTLVLRHSRTRRERAKRALATLQQVDAHMAGIVLNGIPVKESVGEGYAYAYDFGYGYNLRSVSTPEKVPTPGAEIADGPRPARDAPTARQSRKARSRSVRKTFALLPNRKPADKPADKPWPVSDVVENGYRESDE